MQKLNPVLFDWTIWRNGTPLDMFGVPFRRLTIGFIKPSAIRYAIGYCDGESLICRPKLGTKAVMFYKNNQYYWFHMYNSEFDFIFS